MKRWVSLVFLVWYAIAFPSYAVAQFSPHDCLQAQELNGTNLGCYRQFIFGNGVTTNNGDGSISVAGGSGGGDVSGAGSSAVGEIVVYGSTNGKLLGNSNSSLSTDGTFGAASNSLVPTSLAVRTYVDSRVTGIQWKTAVRVATTGNGTLASAYENGDTVDGVTLATNDRILIKNQTTATENGIYTVNASGAPTRATDADTGAEILNATVLVTAGTVNAFTTWTNNNASAPTLGSTNITFAQMNAGNVYTASTGLSLAGGAFSIDSTVVTLTGSQSLSNKTLVDPLIGKVIGGTTAGSTLTLQSTNAAGTSDSIIFKTGSQVTAGTFRTGGALNLVAGLETPVAFKATDGTTNFSMISTLTAVDYLEFSAGQSGQGGTVTVKSGTDTNAPMTFAALGNGAVNFGNGDFATPILSVVEASAVYAYPAVTRFLNSGSLVSVALIPPDGGAFTLWAPGYGAGLANSGGNRVPGTDAVDLQTCYTSGSVPFDNTRVASGLSSFAVNCNNSATGSYSSARGNFTIAGGQASDASGESTQASGTYGLAQGRRAADLGHYATQVFSAGYRAAQSDSQYRRMMGRCTSSGSAASTCRLTADAGAASTINSFNIGNASSNRMMTLGCLVSAKVIGTTGSQAWYFRGVLQRAANTTTYAGDAAGTAIGTLGTVNTIAIAVSADDTVDGLNITFTDTTGIGGSGFNVVAICDGVEAA